MQDFFKRSVASHLPYQETVPIIDVLAASIDLRFLHTLLAATRVTYVAVSVLKLIFVLGRGGGGGSKGERPLPCVHL